MDQQETIQDIRDRLTKIEGLLENIKNTNDLKLENMEEKIKVANHRIGDLEDTIRWLWRTLAGGIAAGLIGMLFAFIK
ncbi:hemolysin XhlA [Clostridium botulinum]|uniref:hemolysin XhlA family protein n=1 Tax=Clostridium botulinum TaxID=1491 RepID=UPI00059759B8|nr:hemolysin XhlA family protein [Clostridium botulinum]KIL07456.1 hemolysin XhlA [Clostridium botulinum]MBN1042196.1 hemolysin XhlA [Clostridium botulinum]MBN1055671.1 hemolysin XhlA [Clostridium botulinum]MBY6934510.1 hemolysin XhlA family protein [Clostridium botulinum]NFL83305.1 hemolysin XhlA [Clostridium botulinum]